MRRKSTHFFLGFLAFAFSFQARGRDRVEPPADMASRFSWSERRVLSWEDFRGPVDTVSHESAAATCCSIAFSLSQSAAGQPVLSVYNTFYVGRSWVKEDARIASILAHEQGHFDLCELFTRKLRERLDLVDLSAANAKEQLLGIYTTVNDEYENCQQAYEHETAHGTKIAAQSRWRQKMDRELGLNPS